MDERQAQIREGAGLEESKLNVEFIDWLRRWSTPLLMVIALVALGFVVYQRLERAHLAKVDAAFAELNAALSNANPNPESLKSIAQSYEGVRAVPSLARTSAADLYLASARTGVKIGAKLKQDGSVDAEDLLGDADRARNLDEAERLYKTVLDANVGDNAKALQAMSAAYGLAAVAECRGKLDEAKGCYEQVKKIADMAGFPEQARVAQERIAVLPSLAEKPKLFAQSELPKAPEPPAPPGATGATGATGGTGESGASGETGMTGGTGASGATGTTGDAGSGGMTGATAPTPPATGAPAAPSSNPPSAPPPGATGGTAATGSAPAAPAAPATLPPSAPK